ncbi:MAG: CD1247 N-terminal domain-containing protein [Acidobacteriota bacterium]
MKKLAEKISYLQGLGEGMNVAEGGPQGRMIAEILDTLAEVADTITGLRRDVEDLRVYVESIDDGLMELEGDIYEEADANDFIEVQCKKCGETVYFESDLLEDDDVIEVVCPKCNEVVYVNDGSFDYDPSIMGDNLDDKAEDRTLRQ